MLRQIILPDAQGRYHFDEMGEENLPEYPGYLPGYFSGPLFPETEEERQGRLTEDSATCVLQEV